MSADGEPPVIIEDQLELRLDTFARQALARECKRLEVTPQELVEFALAYYLADLDSDRINRRIPRPPPGTVPS